MLPIGRVFLVLVAVILGGAVLPGCSMVEVGAVSIETPTRTPIPSIRLPTREPTQIPVPTPTWTPLPTKTPTPIPTSTPVVINTPTVTPIPTPIGYHWSKNPNLYFPFAMVNYWHYHITYSGGKTWGVSGNSNCKSIWGYNNGLLIQIATHGNPAANYYTPQEAHDAVKKYNFPLEICDKHFPSPITGVTFHPPTDEQWVEYGLDLKHKPDFTRGEVDWSKGTRETIPVFIVGDQAEYERLLAERNKYLDSLRSQLTDDERNEEESEGDEEE